MKMEKLEVPAQWASAPDLGSVPSLPKPGKCRQSTGAAVVGVMFILVAVPYWSARLLAELLAKDLRRAGWALGVFGTTYLEALRRNS
jgi:hypothetical protein